MLAVAGYYNLMREYFDIVHNHEKQICYLATTAQNNFKICKLVIMAFIYLFLVDIGFGSMIRKHSIS